MRFPRRVQKERANNGMRTTVTAARGRRHRDARCQLLGIEPHGFGECGSEFGQHDTFAGGP